jgi:hypothetical protein
MADFSMNVNYAKPQTTSLGEMVNLAGGIQNFQQAQQLNPLALQRAQQEVEQARQMNPLALEKAQIENQVIKQKNDERLRLQEFTSNPDNWQTNGRIDMDKLNSLIPKIAPLTGSEVISSFSGLHKSQTDATTAKNSMTQNMRQIVGGRLGILGRMGIDDPKTVIGELDRLKSENPDSREVHDLIEAYKFPLSRASRGPNVVKDLIAQEQSLLSPAQKETLSPSIGTVDTGVGIQPVVTTKSVAGAAPTLLTSGQIIPKDIGPQIVELNGIKYYLTPSKVPGGQPTLTPVGAEGVTPPNAQQGNVPQVNAPQVAAPQVAQRKPVVVEDMPVPQGGIPQLNTFQQARLESGNLLIKNSVEAANAAKEGEETSRQVKNYMSSAAGSAPGQFLRKAGQWVAGDPQLEILSKNLADQQLRNMQIMGARTDAASSDVKAASGKADLTREGLQAIVDRTDASNTAVTAFQKGLKRYTDQGLNGIVHADKFKEAWADNYDVRVFKAMNILNSNMSQAQKQMEQQKLLKGLTNAQLKDLQEKASNIERLQNGGR